MNGKLPKMVKIPSAQWEKPNTIIPNSAKERFVFSTTKNFQVQQNVLTIALPNLNLNVNTHAMNHFSGATNYMPSYHIFN